MDLGIHSFLEFAVGTVIIVILPGPNSLYVITASARLGERAGWRAAGGILTGDTILMVATAAGAASMMTLFPTAFTLMKAVGALYLGWIGLQLLRDGWQRWRNSMSAPVVGPPGARPSRRLKRPLERPLKRPLLEGPWSVAHQSQGHSLFHCIFDAVRSGRCAFGGTGLPEPGRGGAGREPVVSGAAHLCGLRLQGTFAAHPRWAASGIFLVSLCFLGFAASILLGA